MSRNGVGKLCCSRASETSGASAEHPRARKKKKPRAWRGLGATWKNTASIWIIWNQHRDGPRRKMQSANDALNLASEEILNQCQNDRDETDVPNTISAWIRRNTLDPMIHQGVFRYLRAQELLSHGFGIESIVAFDCTLQSVGNFLHLR